MTTARDYATFADTLTAALERPDLNRFELAAAFQSCGFTQSDWHVDLGWPLESLRAAIANIAADARSCCGPALAAA
jgi:hypothetical protein